MRKPELLPGVGEDTCPPVAIFDSAKAIRRARRNAAIRDTAQLVLLVLVDWLFVHWPNTHVPTVDREHSVLLVALLNAALITHVIVSRSFPRWSAHRIARTWGLAERARFFQH